MKWCPAGRVGMVLSIIVIIAGALVVTLTDLGIVGFALIILGLCFEAYAVTRPRIAPPTDESSPPFVTQHFP